MVRVHEEGGFSVYIYSPPREHEPPHVHVEHREGGEVLIFLGDDETPPSPWRNHHMATVRARAALRIVETHRAWFLEEWSRLHD